MRIADGVESLDLTMEVFGSAQQIHPALLWDGRDGATLVDAGFPGQIDAFTQAIHSHGIGWGDVHRLILTHQDVDHIGSAAVIASRAPRLTVLAHAADAPAIRGEQPLIKWSPERAEQMLQRVPEEHRDHLRAFLANRPTCRVDALLTDGESLPWYGGIRVIHTPGHAPGHVSLWVEGPRLLIAGDALRVEDGLLVGPRAAVTPDMEEALRSVHKLGDLPAEYVLCYHGGLFGPGAAARLRELAG